MTAVLIAGAGPTGLTLACDLARRGVACRVVDKARALFIGSRAKGLQPRTLEVFEDLGVLDAVFSAGAPFPPFRLYSGTTLLSERSLEEMLRVPIPPPTARVPHPRPWLIPQWATDRILADRALELGVSVELGAELVSFEQNSAGISATVLRDGVPEIIRAEYLVGADGGRSRVRKLCGVSFEGETFQSERTLIGDVRACGIEGTACHIFTRDGDAKTRFSLWNLPGGEHYQFVANLGDEEPELSLGFVRQLFEARSGRSDLRLDDLRWISNYRINVRMVDRFRVGRVFLAGDAAHVHSSAGGQGLNTGVQDAYNLGWKLGAVLAGAPPALLDTYEEERLPIAASVLGLSSLLHRRSFSSTTATPSPSIDQLELNYRTSSLAWDDREQRGELRAGDRAPDARLPDGRRLHQLMRGPQFTLLGFGAEDRGASGAIAVEALDGYDVERGVFVLIRPDGHVGAISPSLERIKAYPGRSFSQAASIE